MRAPYVGLLLSVLFLGNVAFAREVIISDTERLVCPDAASTYQPGGSYIPGVPGRLALPSGFPNGDVTVRMITTGENQGCVRVTVTNLLTPTQCGTMTLYLTNNSDSIQRSRCDSTGRPITPGNETGYTGPQVNLGELEAIWASWPSSVK